MRANATPQSQPTSSHQGMPHHALIQQLYWQNPNFPTAQPYSNWTPPAPPDKTSLTTEPHISIAPQPSVKNGDGVQDFPSSYVLASAATPTHLTYWTPTMLHMSGDSYTATGTPTTITHAGPITLYHDASRSPSSSSSPRLVSLPSYRPSPHLISNTTYFLSPNSPRTYPPCYKVHEHTYADLSRLLPRTTFLRPPPSSVAFTASYSHPHSDLVFTLPTSTPLTSTLSSQSRNPPTTPNLENRTPPLHTCPTTSFSITSPKPRKPSFPSPHYLRPSLRPHLPSPISLLSFTINI